MSGQQAQARESRTCTVGLPQGLHLRPVQRLAALAESFDSIIQIKNGNKQNTVRGVLSLMTLGLAPGTEVEITAEGPDARQTAHTIQVLLHHGTLLAYGEEKDAEGGSIPPCCSELASVVRAFDSEVSVMDGEFHADAGEPVDLAALMRGSAGSWEVRATGPDAVRAQEVVGILLEWLGRRGRSLDDPEAAH